MLPLNIESTLSTPAVQFDPDHCRLVIQGESYPENAAAFYEPLLSHIGKWLKADGRPRLEVCFELRYYNSSSSKAIMNLLDLLEASAAKGADISVLWRFDAENEIIQESGEEFQEDYPKLNIRLVAFSEGD